MPLVLDTHAWVWWATEDRRLSKPAARAIAGAATSDGVSISAISVWEVAKKVEKQQLVLDRPPRDYAHVQTAW
jgi:PIN domain nuclease of toxin-antitoxin system